LFKKMFGPKKMEASGQPVEPEALREALLALLPSQGEVNKHLRIEKHDKFPEGFNAVWQMYVKERDPDDSFRYHTNQLTLTLSAEIDPGEKSVRFKVGQKQKSARVPQGETLYDPWYGQVKVGKLEDLQAEVEAEAAKRSYSFSNRKLTEPLAVCAAANGWDAYY
jgi:hypothetical protein